MCQRRCCLYRTAHFFMFAVVNCIKRCPLLSHEVCKGHCLFVCRAGTEAGSLHFEPSVTSAAGFSTTSASHTILDVMKAPAISRTFSRPSLRPFARPRAVLCRAQPATLSEVRKLLDSRGWDRAWIDGVTERVSRRQLQPSVEQMTAVVCATTSC
jgi:hypothetical protein